MRAPRGCVNKTFCWIGQGTSASQKKGHACHSVSHGQVLEVRYLSLYSAATPWFSICTPTKCWWEEAVRVASPEVGEGAS
jgi:hypothetical protein